MKRLLPCFWLLLVGTLPVVAQHDVEAILAQTPVEMPAYDTTSCERCIYLGIAYGGTAFLNMEVLKLFDGEAVEEVEMVYSSFARTRNFDQTSLNRERLHRLLSVAPELFDEQVERWRVVRQTNCRTLEESERLFHGFVVHIKPRKAVRTKGGTLAPVDEALAKKKIYKPLVYRDTVVKRQSVNIVRQTKRSCEPTGRYLPRDDDKRRAGVRYDTDRAMLLWKRKIEKQCTTFVSYRYDTLVRTLKLKVHPVTGKLLDASPYLGRKDSTIQEAMDRNWWEWQSEKCIVVQDVTSSMTDLLPQTLMWNEMNAGDHSIEHFVFFNDGDGKPSNKKVLGKTGGVYYVVSESLETIQDKANYAASQGNGGDTAENNVEALLFAEEKCPDCRISLMVADNYAPVRDLALAKNLRRTVRILVCGEIGMPVHADYVTIAALTGGSIHTQILDVDLHDAMSSGQPVIVGDYKYVFQNGRFNRVE